MAKLYTQLNIDYGKTLEKIRRNSITEKLSRLKMVDIQNCDGTGEGGDNCLKEASPLLFILVSHENATIADM